MNLATIPSCWVRPTIDMLDRIDDSKVKVGPQGYIEIWIKVFCLKCGVNHEFQAPILQFTVPWINQRRLRRAYDRDPNNFKWTD